MRNNSSEFDHIELRAQKGPFKPSGARPMGPHSRTQKASVVYLYLFCEKPGDFTGLKPVSLSVGEETFPLKNWRDLLLKACDILARGNRQLFRQQALWIGKAFLAEKPEGLHAPRLHEPSGLFMELNQSANSIVRHVRLLFERAMYNLDEITLICSYGAPEGRTEKGNRRCKAPSANVTAGEDTAELESLFEADIVMYYPHGFDFKETSKRLVEARVGRPMPNGLCKTLRTRMFQRSDGIWLLPRMVASESTQERMTAQAKALLGKEGAFAMDSLYGEFEGELHNISPGHDFKLFFNKCIAEQVGGKVRGFEGWQVCFRATTEDDAGWEAIGDRIREVLVCAGDAVSVEDILTQLPHLDREVVLRVGARFIQDIVSFSLDDIEYLKLLEAYYLPEDFGDTLAAFVAETEAKQGVVSIVQLEAALNAKYGEGFRINFGLEDDDVFKQVIASSFVPDGHNWVRDLFVCEHCRSESNVIETFLRGHTGVFHEEDFFEFALESRGMKNRGMLILTFLRKHCVRLSKDWWISQRGFDEKFALTEEQYSQIGDALNRAVGNSSFMPIASLSDEVYESFPHLELNGEEIVWNPYLLTSLSVLRVKNARVVNDEPSPYTVTAMIVPLNVGEIADVVEYALNAYPPGYFRDANAAFEYLKANNIRVSKTGKLLSKINEILKAG